jgi:hypothetical protein
MPRKPAAPKVPRVRHAKYGAMPTVVDGVRFASRKEARRYQVLLTWQRAHLISELELQPPFRLVVNGIGVGTYRADFAYLVDGRQVVEDVKGVRTPVYRLKKRMVEAQYGIEIIEV